MKKLYSLFFVLFFISCSSISKDYRNEDVISYIENYKYVINDSVVLKNKISKLLFNKTDLYHQIRVKKTSISNNDIYYLFLSTQYNNKNIYTVRLLKRKHKRLFFHNVGNYKFFYTCIDTINNNSNCKPNLYVLNKKYTFVCGKKGECSLQSKCSMFKTLVVDTEYLKN